MDTNRKVFGNFSSALGAELRCVPGGYFNNQAASLLRFVPEYIKEPKPGCISHRLIKAMVIGIPGIHLFNTNSAVVLQQLFNQFEMKVSPLVINLFMGFGHENSSFRPSFRTFLSARQSLLPHSKFTLRLLKEAGVVYLHAIRGCQKGLTANINAHNPVRGPKEFKRNIITRETDVPFTRGMPSDSNCLNVSFYGPGQPQFKSADISDSEVFAFKFPACLFKGEAVISISALKPGKSWFFPILHPAEEGLVSSIKAFKNILKYLRTYLLVFWKCNFELRKFLNLVIARYGMTAGTIGRYSLFKGYIVKLTAQRKPMLGLVDSLGISLDMVLKTLFPLHNSSIANLKKGVKSIHPTSEGMDFLTGYSIDIYFH